MEGGGGRDQSDLFSELFGGGGRRGRSGPRRGEDMVHHLQVSLEDLYKGKVRVFVCAGVTWQTSRPTLDCRRAATFLLVSRGRSPPRLLCTVDCRGGPGVCVCGTCLREPFGCSGWLP